MRSITPREKRTIRLAALGIAIYLGLFYGWRVWHYLDHGRRQYLQLIQDARILQQQLEPYEDKAQALKKLMDQLRVDPAKLNRATVVAETSAALQKTAITGGLQLGSIRESPVRSASLEMAQVQFEGTGPVPAVLAFLYRLESLGRPLVVEAVQLNAEPTKPGMVKLTLTIIILDYEQWKKEKAAHA